MKVGQTLTAVEVLKLHLFPTSRKHTFKRASQIFEKSGKVGIIEVEFDPYDGTYTVVDQYIKNPSEISQRLYEEAFCKSEIVNFGIAQKICKTVSKKCAKPRIVKAKNE
jgi:hypothetical protein